MESALNSSQQACRLCLRETSLGNIFHEEGLCGAIQDYLSIAISPDDGMSHAICTTCKALLRDFHQFRLGCLQVQAVLESRHQNGGAEYGNGNGEQFQHMRNHGSPTKQMQQIHGPNRYDCTRCDMSFVKRNHLQSHLIQFHQLSDDEQRRDMREQAKPARKTRRSRRPRRRNNTMKYANLEEGPASTDLPYSAVQDQQAGIRTEGNVEHSESHRRNRRRRPPPRRRKPNHDDGDRRQLEQSPMQLGNEPYSKCKFETDGIERYRSPEWRTKDHVQVKQEPNTRFSVQPTPPRNGIWERDAYGSFVPMFDVEKIKIEPVSE